jgi:uncharacterized protein (DUF2147 family)
MAVLRLIGELYHCCETAKRDQLRNMSYDMKKYFISLVLLFVATNLALAESPAGLWLLDNGKLTVKVSECGENICGVIAGLEEPLQKDGSPKLDFQNPDEALRSRHIIGLPVFNGLRPNGENQWKGKIYSADDGGTYRAYATLVGDRFEVKGCWGPFCKDLNFKRIK